MLKSFGRALVLIREMRGMSQVALARKAGIGKSQLSKYESDRELPRLDTLMKVLDSLGIGLFELSYTMKILDFFESESTAAPQEMPLLATGQGSSFLPSDASEAFRAVYGDLLELYAMVHSAIVRRRLE